MVVKVEFVHVVYLRFYKALQRVCPLGSRGAQPLTRGGMRTFGGRCFQTSEETKKLDRRLHRCQGSERHRKAGDAVLDQPGLKTLDWYPDLDPGKEKQTSPERPLLRQLLKCERSLWVDSRHINRQFPDFDISTLVV